jgi:hypothetical protein
MGTFARTDLPRYSVDGYVRPHRIRLANFFWRPSARTDYLADFLFAPVRPHRIPSYSLSGVPMPAQMHLFFADLQIYLDIQLYL